MIPPPQADFDFPGKDRAERVQFYFRHHWVKIVWPLTRLIFWTVVFLLGSVLVENMVPAESVLLRRALLLILLGFFLLSNFLILLQTYKHLLWVTIVTDKKIHRIRKSLLLINEHQSIDLWTLEDISMDQRGIMQNIFGYGSLHMIMQAKDVGMTIRYTPGIVEKHRRIMILREKARSQAMLRGQEDPQNIPSLAILPA